MNKGIVMEISDHHLIVMTPQGRFEKLPRNGRTCEVGEEILFAEPHRVRKVPGMAKASALIAAVVLCLVVFAGLTDFMGSKDIVAYVSMDINPSIEIGIDADELVRELRGLNDDGTKLIANLNYKGKKLEEVTAAILDKAEQGPLAIGEGDIVIASTVVKDNAKINDAVLADKLKKQVTQHIAYAHPNQAGNYDVTAFAAPLEIRAEAEAKGLSMGKYAIYLNAKNNGNPLPLDEFKTESIHQIAKQSGGIDKLVDPSKPPAKTVFKQLLEEEKSGKLDERAQQLAQQKNDGKNKNGSSGKSSAAGKSNGKADDKKDDNKNENKNDNKNDDKKETVPKPVPVKPAGGERFSEQGDYIKKNGEASKQDNRQKDSKSKDDEKNKNDEKPRADDKTSRGDSREDAKKSADEKKTNSPNKDDSGKEDSKNADRQERRQEQK